MNSYSRVKTGYNKKKIKVLILTAGLCMDAGKVKINIRTAMQE